MVYNAACPHHGSCPDVAAGQNDHVGTDQDVIANNESRVRRSLIDNKDITTSEVAASPKHRNVRSNSNVVSDDHVLCPGRDVIETADRAVAANGDASRLRLYDCERLNDRTPAE